MRNFLATYEHLGHSVLSVRTLECLVLSLWYGFWGYMGVDKFVFMAIFSLFLLIFVDYTSKKRAYIRKFGGLKNAIASGEWRSSVGRQGMKNKVVDYSLIIISSTIVVGAFNGMGDLSIFGIVRISQIQAVVRLFVISILCGIEYDSIIENVSGNFERDSRAKILFLGERVKDATLNNLSLAVENIIEGTKRQHSTGLERTSPQEAEAKDRNDGEGDTLVSIEEECILFGKGGKFSHEQKN